MLHLFGYKFFVLSISSLIKWSWQRKTQHKKTNKWKIRKPTALVNIILLKTMLQSEVMKEKILFFLYSQMILLSRFEH